MKISQAAIAALDAATFDGTLLRLSGQLDRKLYVDVNKALEAAGGKWNRKLAAHVFDGDALDAVQPMILTGEVTSAKQELGQFDTPPELAEYLARLSNIEAGMSVLEPSCGVGNLVHAAVNLGANVLGVEFDGARYKTAKDRFAHLYFANGADPVVGIANDDFMTCDPSILYDRVLMNPPFARQADVDHVTRALRFLQPGGRLVSVMSAGVLFRENRKTAEFRKLVEIGGYFQKLPPASFKASGTTVETCVLVFEAAR